MYNGHNIPSSELTDNGFLVKLNSSVRHISHQKQTRQGFVNTDEWEDAQHNLKT